MLLDIIVVVHSNIAIAQRNIARLLDVIGVLLSNISAFLDVIGVLLDIIVAFIIKCYVDLSKTLTLLSKHLIFLCPLTTARAGAWFYLLTSAIEKGITTQQKSPLLRDPSQFPQICSG
jgi:hypothetical protein